MKDRYSTRLDRRTMLALFGSGSAAALAGCLGGDDGAETTTPAGTETTSDEVPDAYRTATALNGNERDPGSLVAKSDLSYQPEPKNGQQCSGCAYYVPDKNDDGVGACTIVEGTIEPTGYCTSYVAHEDETSSGDNQARSPTDVPQDAQCAVCNMKAANFPTWNAQAVHADDTREFFCTSGCATTYYAVPGEFADTDADIAGLWVRDMESRDLVDGTTAYYALETDADRLDDPMRVNPAPFAAREDAVAYVDEVEYLTEDDIVELAAFDRELAEQYRGQLLE
ncbi:nitrous oxide reductase accessory protein NosL [Halorubellus salinus]|uniref:nitrous oxide reductase accessory protein NosL n=1 Tax=Halorubellus salinus TaxID=755309 RepID=UPI001D069762|nr:nitrous oxide reductase accessory protein NosL [Halorubellus salinus]